MDRSLAEAMMRDDTFACPRCGGTDFDELHCGPDSYENDITYQADRCKTCDLVYSGWTDRWYEADGCPDGYGVEEWQATENE